MVFKVFIGKGTLSMFSLILLYSSISCFFFIPAMHANDSLSLSFFLSLSICVCVSRYVHACVCVRVCVRARVCVCLNNTVRKSRRYYGKYWQLVASAIIVNFYRGP